MSGIGEASKLVSVNATFVGGTEDGKTRSVWPTRELLVVVQTPPVASADEVKKMDFKTLMSKTSPKPARQIYELVATRGDDVVYRLKSVEAAE